MIPWIIGGVLVVITNILVWVFLWGKAKGSVNTRLEHLEDAEAHRSILSECAETFAEIKGSLGELKGKVETILLIVTENQKNTERSRIRKESKSKPKQKTKEKDNASKL